jgi:hypothetical protein
MPRQAGRRGAVAVRPSGDRCGVDAGTSAVGQDGEANYRLGLVVPAALAVVSAVVAANAARRSQLRPIKAPADDGGGTGLRAAAALPAGAPCWSGTVIGPAVTRRSEPPA